MVEKTLCIIKPNVFDDGHVEESLARIKSEGFVVLASRYEQLAEGRARAFYAEHEGKPFMAKLVKYMCRGPSLLLALGRENAIAKWREVIGPTSGAPEKAPQSLRGKFGAVVDGLSENGFHGSDSPQSAAREILFFFPRFDMSMTSAPAPEAATKAAKDIVFILGGPGSGKGTQCARLSEEFKLAHLSTGDLLRAEIAKGTPDGIAASAFMKEGKLVPQELVIKLLGNAIEATEKRGVLVDGFPRSVEQLLKFESMVRPCKVAIFFDCSEETMLKRIMKRAAETPADQRRPDDNPEVATKRFRTFKAESEPAIAKLREAGRLVTVSSEADVDTVHKKLRQLFLI